MRTQTLLTSCMVVLLHLSGPSFAENDTVNFAGQDPTEDEIKKALTPSAPTATGTRGVQPGATAISNVGAAAAPSTIAPRKASFDQITFERNSDKLSPKAKTVLDRVGRVLASDDLFDIDVVVEGHTDITGSLPYNMSLSKRRADSVRRYLVEHQQIDPNRIKTTGKGPTELMDKDHPDSGVNRRVVFVSVDPARQQAK
jgi:OOP family OmpA-OmpF porin